MKLQFSLRTLVIVFLVASLGVWYGVWLYFKTVRSPEMDKRFRYVMGVLNQEVARLDAEYYRGPVRRLVNQDSTSSDNSSTSHWEIKKGSWFLGAENKRIESLKLRVSCEREKINIRPIVIEDFGGVDNEGAIKLLMEVCEKEKWAYEVRKDLK